jgi:cyclohexa-1,5-dienecarbonyl-CoA hydratase
MVRLGDDEVSSAEQQASPSIEVSLLENSTVLRILLNRPKGNVIGSAMMAEIGAALAGHRDDAHLRLVILRGAGGTFSFGASVEEHRKDQAEAMLGAFHQLVRDLASYPVPVAALVEGRCLGGAFEIVMCCHLVFTTGSARFGCPEIKLGVFPPVLAVAGAARLGSALSERLLLTGEELDAAASERVGFSVTLDAALDPEEALLAWYRTHLAPLSAFALRQAVHAARERSALLVALGGPLHAAERQYLQEVLSSHDGNEGIESFLARRPPAWRDA